MKLRFNNGNETNNTTNNHKTNTTNNHNNGNTYKFHYINNSGLRLHRGPGARY